MRCPIKQSLAKGTRTSWVSAITLQGIEAIKIFPENGNAVEFEGFVEHDLVRVSTVCSSTFANKLTQTPILTPYPGPRSVVVMDNASIHHRPETREWIEDYCGGLLTSSLLIVLTDGQALACCTYRPTAPTSTQLKKAFRQ